jgi:glycosyltransferase involved in cell wall biosynthesis
VISHKQNKCLGGARNTGLEMATGEYIWLIDSDDMIPLDACELLFSVINKANADIIRFNILNFQQDNKARLGDFFNTEECMWPYNKIINKNLHSRLGITQVTACSFVCISSHIKKYKFRELVFHEDCDFVPILFSDAENIYCVNTTLYFRRLHNKSVTGGEIPIEKRIVYKLYAIKSLNHYIKSSKLGKSHFCVKMIIDDLNETKKYYNKYPQIHNPELDSIIKDIEKFDTLFAGDQVLYNDIITTYGNTKLLEFFLRCYRFILKKLY